MAICMLSVCSSSKPKTLPTPPRMDPSVVSSLRLIGVNCGAAFSWQRCRPMSEGPWGQQCSKPEQTHQGDLGCCPEAYKEPQASSVVPKIGLLSPQREKTIDEKRDEQNALSCSCIVSILLEHLELFHLCLLKIQPLYISLVQSSARMQ